MPLQLISVPFTPPLQGPDGQRQLTEAHAAAQFNAVQLLSVLVDLLPEWLPQRPALYALLLQRWQAPARAARVAQEEHLPKAQVSQHMKLLPDWRHGCATLRTQPALLFQLAMRIAPCCTIMLMFR